MTVALAVVVLIASIALRQRQNHISMQLSRRLLSIRRKRSRGVLKRTHVRPGRGVALAGQKACYQHRLSTKSYQCALEDANWFQSVVHMSVEDFEALYALVGDELDTPLDPWNTLTSEQRQLTRRKKKKLTPKELLFLFLGVMGGGTCGADTLTGMATKYGTSPGTMWKYIYHTGWAVFRGLGRTCPLEWPSVEERKAMYGLIRGFPEAVLFCDRTRQPVFRSVYDDVQNDQYYGKDRIHCFGVLVYVDVYGLIRRIEVTFSGRLQDKTIFQLSDVYLNRENYFSPGEKLLCDAGFLGAGSPDWIICPFKKGTGLSFQLRSEWNKDVRQRVRNEMGIGYLKNRNRVFMGKWPYSEELFRACITSCAMIMNWKLTRNGKQIISIEQMIARMKHIEKLIFASSDQSQEHS